MRVSSLNLMIYDLSKYLAIVPWHRKTVIFVIFVCVCSVACSRQSKGESQDESILYKEARSEIYDGKIDAVAKIISSHPELIRPRLNGETLLHHAAMTAEDDRIISLLISNGSEIDIRAGEGMTPLHEASLNCNLIGCKALLKHGADVNARTSLLDTPLLLAIKGEPTNRNRLAVIELLLKEGADPLLMDCDHRPWFDIVLDRLIELGDDDGSVGIVDIMLRHHADLKQKGAYNGWTIFHRALTLESGAGDRIVSRLLDDEVSPLMVAADGETVYNLAMRTRGKPYADMLLLGAAAKDLPLPRFPDPEKEASPEVPRVQVVQ